MSIELSKEQPRSLKSARTLCLRYDIPTSKTARFWEELEKGKIYSTKCGECGAISFPPAADCSRCYSTKMTWVPLGSMAKLEAVTLINVRPASFSGEEPYLIAVGRIRKGVKVFARLRGVRIEEAKIGMNMTLLPTRTPQGALAYEFMAESSAQ